MKSIKILPQQTLKGTVSIPASKSVSHRAIMCAALSDGKSKISNLTFSRDIDSTCSVFRKLGAKIEYKDSILFVEGTNPLYLVDKDLFCDESGSTLRFIIPIALLQGEEVTFSGAGRLVERPLDPYYNIFKSQNIAYTNNNGQLPLIVSGSLKPGDFSVKGNVSSQFISGLLFALPCLNGDSTIYIEGDLESKPYIDLTIEALKKFNIEIINKNYEKFLVKGNQKYIASDFSVEGDFSQAAFWLAASVINGDISCTNLNFDSLQGDKKIIDIIKTMGGDLKQEGSHIDGSTSKLKGTRIDASQIPDLVPILTVLAALSEGDTVIYNAARLRIKECDRLAAISTELNKIGADIEEKEDSLIIHGKPELEGGEVDSWNDHRIVMSMAIASLRCKNPVVINNYEAVAKSYPHFFEDLQRLGGKVDGRSLGE